jgi:Ala-tRNA(Pro) deacylase
MKLTNYLQDQGVSFSTHEHPPAYTAQEVAAQEHVSGKMLAKTVVVRADEGYAMCVLPANRKLDLDKAAAAMNTQAVRLADESELAKLFDDVEVGAEPPFGNLYDMPTWVDKHLTEDEEIMCQAGSHRQAVRLKYADYARLVEPETADLAVQL